MVGSIIRCAVIPVCVLAALNGCKKDPSTGAGSDTPPAPTGPLKILSMGPVGDVTGPFQVHASFDKTVTKLGEMDDTKARALLRLTPQIPGNYRFLGTQTVVFEPKGDAPRSTEFVAEVPTTARAVDGSAPAAPERIEFATLRLQLMESWPRANITDAPGSPAFTLTFNQPVKLEDLSASTTFVVAGQQASVAASCKDGPNKRIPAYICTSLSAIPSSSKVELVVAQTLHGAEGPMPMKEAVRIPFSIHGPLRVVELKCSHAECRPESGATIKFSNRVVPKAAFPFIEITPAVERASEAGTYASNTLYLGRLKPSTQYSVKVKAGLPDEFGQAITTEQTLTLTTTKATPSAQVPRGMLTMEPGRTTLPIRATNAESATLRLWKIAPNEAAVLARGLGSHESDLKPRASDSTRQLSLAGKLDEPLEVPLDFSEFLQDGVGLVGYSVTFPKVMQWSNHALVADGFIQVTTLGVTVKSWPSGTVAWVTELASGKSAAGVELTMTDEAGTTLWKGVSDENGIAAADVSAPEGKSVWVLARRGNDVAVSGSAFGDGLGPWELGAESSWPNSNGEPVGLLFTDRGVYKPGESLHVKVLARLLKYGELQVPANLNAMLILTGPTGDEVTRKPVKISALGTAHATLGLDSGSRLGNYGLRLEMGADGASLYTNVLVEQFKAPDFELTVTTERPEIVRGDTVTAAISSMYLFGAPLAGAKLKTTASLTPTSFAPPGVENFTFDDEGRYFEQLTPDSSLLNETEAMSDAMGNVAYSVTVAPEKMTGPQTLLLEATAVDAAGTAVTGRQNVLVHPGQHYLGLRTSTTLIQAGQPVSVEAVALKPDGTPANASATVFLRRREYRAVKQQGLGNSEETLQTFEDVEVAKCSLSGLAKAPKSCSVTAPKAGLHLLSMEGTDAANHPLLSRRVLWVSGSGEAPWATDDSLAIKLVADKASYKPGDVAKVLIQNPFPDSDGLLTVERGGVITRRMIKLAGNAPVVEIPVEEAHVPNVYVGVVVVRGRKGPPPKGKGPDKDKPSVRGGYAKIVVDPGTRRLAVSVTPDATEYGPRDKVSVVVDLKDSAGKPVAGEVALFVVDESVLKLTQFATPDPVSILYAHRGIQVRTGDNRVHLVDARSYGEKGEEEGGGGLGELLGEDAIRSRFLTTPYFNPAIKIPASGSANVSFELPDNLTAFRLMALAVSDGNRVGSAQNALKVRKPLMLRPATVRVLRLGDDAQIGVVIVNSTAQAGEVEVRAENKTPDNLSLSGKPVTVNVPAGASVPVRFQVKGIKAGQVILRFGAKLGNHTDGLEQKFYVQHMMPLVHDATYGLVAAGDVARIPLGVPASAVPDVGGLTLALSTSILSAMRGVAQQVRLYPYDCAEQTSSKLFALSEMGASANQYDGVQDAELAWNSDMARAIRKLLTLQNDDGGFGFWKGYTSDPYLTAYAALALHRAQKSGAKVNTENLHRAQAFLKNALNHEQAGWLRVQLDDTRALVVDVLATLGDPAVSHANRLVERRAKLSPDARALLTHAAAVTRAMEKGLGPMLDDLASMVHQSPKGATVQATSEPGLFNSPVRTHALVLRALMAGKKHPELVDKLTTGLIAQQRNGQYRTTQEAGWALLAIRDFQQAFESGPMDLSLVASVGGATLVETRFEKREPVVNVNTLPIKDVKNELAISAKGTGNVRYGATISYAPGQLPNVTTERGFTLERRLTTVQGVTDGASVTMGELHLLKVEVVTPADRNFVVVDVPVPAGLELVNARFATSESVKPAASEPNPDEYEGEEEDIGPVGDPLAQGVFDHVELREDRLVLFANQMPRGLHSYVIGVRTVTPGKFAFSPARAEEMYAPEVFGMTPGSTLSISEGKTR